MILKKFLNLIKNTTESKRLSLVLCLISGFIGVIPYYFESLFICTFISLIFVFYVVLKQKNTRKRYFSPFFFYFLGFYTPLYLFLSELYPYERFGFTDGQASLIVVCSCIIIPLIHSLVSAGVMYISKFFRGNMESVLGYGALWCISEWVLSLGMLAFPWGNIAVSLTGFLPYLQTASFFGKYFISFITVCGCAYIVYGCLNKVRLISFFGAGIILFNSLLGTVLWLIPAEEQDTVATAVIQGNTSSNDKWKSGKSREIFKQIISLTRQAAENGAEMIVLAESAIPSTFTEGGYTHRSFAEIALDHNTTIIMGANFSENGKEYNSTLAILPDGTLSERYDKRHLVPFGEFIPFVDILGEVLPFVAAFNESSSVFIEGTEPIIINTEKAKIAPLVCFDSIFPDFAREASKEGGEIITIVTNDSWFNDSAGIYTHLRHAQLRAIENGKFVVRSANTGISAFIDTKGKRHNETQPLVADIIYSDIPIVQEKTLYCYMGDIALYASFIIVAVLLIHSFRIRKNSLK